MMESIERTGSNRIFFSEGTWRATCNSTDGVPLPKTMAYWIRKALYANAWFERSHPRFRNLSYEDKAYREYHSYNCHRTALAMQGTVYDALTNDPSPLAYQASHDFKPGVEADIKQHNSEALPMETLQEKLLKVTPPCVVHIRKDHQQNEQLMHSFVYLGRDRSGVHVCFDKRGGDGSPFRITPLATIEQEYTPRFHVAYIQPTITE